MAAQNQEFYLVLMMPLLMESTSSPFRSSLWCFVSYRAMLRGILTSQSTSNLGPGVGSIVNVAPWVFSVAASSINQHIITKAIMGDNTTFEVFNF
ncbi:subtilisin-like protein protease SBT4.13 [Cinnamomum micranthum f. kanehirae]|uniref:Subtilisin-like protein protease SBT4.13 n=1 Tax=Cinnamomum micranthum f. kanehirae TaxID=337451 RepID=A0A443NBT1_9MAGN|nr:subtilisin-like protein protease SBT4.13 [Cinnamomum micranthum f. kanehirae]